MTCMQTNVDWNVAQNELSRWQRLRDRLYKIKKTAPVFFKASNIQLKRK